MFSVRCTDGAGDNPQWRVNNKTDFSGLAQVRLMGPSFSVISLNWHLVEVRSLTLECFTSSCRLLARAVRPERRTSTTTEGQSSVLAILVIILTLLCSPYNHLHLHHQIRGPGERERVGVLREAEQEAGGGVSGHRAVEGEAGGVCLV